MLKFIHRDVMKQKCNYASIFNSAIVVRIDTNVCDDIFVHLSFRKTIFLSLSMWCGYYPNCSFDFARLTVNVYK